MRPAQLLHPKPDRILCEDRHLEVPCLASTDMVPVRESISDNTAIRVQWTDLNLSTPDRVIGMVVDATSHEAVSGRPGPLASLDQHTLVSIIRCNQNEDRGDESKDEYANDPLP